MTEYINSMSLLEILCAICWNAKHLFNELFRLVQSALLMSQVCVVRASGQKY